MSGEIRFIRTARRPHAWLARNIEGIGIKVQSMRFSGERRGIVGRLMTDFLLVSSVVSDSLKPHELKHARPPCPSPTPRVYSNSSPLCWWCHPTISSSVVPFSSHLQSFPASGAFQMTLFKCTSGGQSIGASASPSVLPMNIQDWFPLGWTGWISLRSKGLSRVFSKTTVQKHQFFSTHLSMKTFSTSLYIPESDSAARPLSYLSQVHLVIINLRNCKSKSAQLSSHIMSIYKEQRTSALCWLERKK